MKEELVYLGVDIAKSYLDTAIGNEKRRFTNDAAGHRELIHRIKQMEGSVQVICEPSGGYEGALVRALVGAQLKISLVPANRVRQFARAAGILAKTDRIDAKLLCAFGEAIAPGAISGSQLEQQHLRELESQRRHLTPLLVMPVPLLKSAAAPLAVLLFPVVTRSAPAPTAVLKLLVLLTLKERKPTAVFKPPVVRLNSAFCPSAVLPPG